MFLGHQFSEDLKAVIGPIATAKLAQHFGKLVAYFPQPKTSTEPLSLNTQNQKIRGRHETYRILDHHFIQHLYGNRFFHSQSYLWVGLGA